VFLLLCVSVLGLNALNSPNLEFVTIGLLGVLAGFVPIEELNRSAKHPYLLAFTYFCYVIAITVWNVPFILLVVGVCLSLMGIYLIGLGNERSRIRRHVILLGRYSLLGYVAQIAILQFLSAGLRHASLRHGVLGISFFAAFVLTISAVEVVDRVRARSIVVNWLYRAAFA
jgi:hypothetical protein